MSVATGHLARLLERVAPAEPALRRRQPALFESSADAITAPAEVEDSAAARPGPPPSPMPTWTQAPPAEPRRGDIAVRDATAPPRARAALPVDAPRIDHTIRVIDSAMASAPAPRMPSTPPAMAVAPERPAAASRDVAPPRSASPRTAAEAPPPVSRAADPTPARTTAPTAQRPIAAVSVPPASARPQAPPPLLPNVRARIAAHRPIVAMPAERPADPPPVEVTIGRIEVRAATAPAAAAPRARANAPRLGLDQYLRERRGQP